ncbi:MAG: entericidin A/B family lipoprotein [Gammaproteobacteria bacterium]|jgi:predicted small secreted protein|nr:entericidin A/B family lipoprotein [Gammaproteobacteria bacterium]
MKRWFALGLMALMAAGLLGCETMQGLGRDISKAGEKIEGAAQK